MWMYLQEVSQVDGPEATLHPHAPHAAYAAGLACVLPSCPQFIVMGPLFHFLKELLNSTVLAVLCSAICESCISYASQTLNA